MLPNNSSKKLRLRPSVGVLSLTGLIATIGFLAGLVDRGDVAGGVEPDVEQISGP